MWKTYHFHKAASIKNAVLSTEKRKPGGNGKSYSPDILMVPSACG